MNDLRINDLFALDDAKSAARHENGILELTLPKKTTASSKRLRIA